MTGEEEDTDVGFPGPGHYIAEREVPMKVAMWMLAVLAVIAGVLQIPGVDDVVTRASSSRRSPTRSSRTSSRRHGSAWIGLMIGAAIAVAGIAIAYRIWVARPGPRRGCASASPAVYTLPVAQVVLR